MLTLSKHNCNLQKEHFQEARSYCLWWTISLTATSRMCTQTGLVCVQVWEVCSFTLNNSTYSLPVFNHTLEDIWPLLTLHYSRIANISGWGKLTSPNMGNNNNLSLRKHPVCWYLIQINDPGLSETYVCV